MSLMVISPVSLKSSSTSKSFSTFFAIKIFSASSSVTVPVAVTRFSWVITSAMGSSQSSRKRRSRRVIMPISRPSAVVIGRPETLYWSMISRARPTLASGRRVSGLKMIPLALRLTFSTSSAWRSMDMFLWMMPTPPS